MSYWDSSALVKLYSKESDSAVFEQFAAGATTVPVISRLGLYEVATTVSRKEAEGGLSPGSAQTIQQRLLQDGDDGRIRVVEFSANVERPFQVLLAQCFQKVPPQYIRTLDAIHLASAIAVGESEIVATDKRLREAALFLGLKVFP